MKRILYPGRFQPFHKGHLRVVEDLLEDYSEVVIVIGSADQGYTCRNPFTASERLEMINLVLKSRGISRDRYWLIPIPDINKPLAWTTYVLSMIPRIDAVATGNPHVAYLYKWLRVNVVELKLYDPEMYNGTRIRELMCKNNNEWKNRVPREVAEYIESINGVERVRRVCSIVC